MHPATPDCLVQETIHSGHTVHGVFTDGPTPHRVAVFRCPLKDSVFVSQRQQVRKTENLTQNTNRDLLYVFSLVALFPFSQHGVSAKMHNNLPTQQSSWKMANKTQDSKRGKNKCRRDGALDATNFRLTPNASGPPATNCSCKNYTNKGPDTATFPNWWVSFRTCYSPILCSETTTEEHTRDRVARAGISLVRTTPECWK